jgi:UDP-N-acetylglucosamine/UDP-N-acetylgalactosamine diphosphorylase
LTSHGQDHLLAAWERWDEPAKRRLERELRSIDLPQLVRLYREGPEKANWAELAARAESPPACRLGDHAPRFSAAEAAGRGAAALASGGVAAVVVAGGQGTRLGFDHPKGMFPIWPTSGATLFQIHLERIRAVARRHRAAIPLYVMTSPATHDETAEFLDRHARFGLAADEVVLFCQGTMPAVDAATGRMLLAEPGGLALSPDGHGGMLAAMVSSGALDDMNRRGIKQLFYFQVDNPLTPICDAELLGYHLLDRSELTTLAVAKQTPDERVGNVVAVDGRVRIIEYSDLPDEAAERRDAAGGLALWAGNTAIHLFDVAFLERVAIGGGGLPFHIALKKTPFLDEHDRLVQPAEPNSLKFERFIFDLLPEAHRALVVEVDKRAAFAPLKNASGEASDTAQHVRAAMSEIFRQWLLAAGATVDDDASIEISPLFALDAQELAARLPAGLRVAGPTSFSEGYDPSSK